jgi:hypothetical protein
LQLSIKTSHAIEIEIDEVPQRRVRLRRQMQLRKGPASICGTGSVFCGLAHVANFPTQLAFFRAAVS